MIDWLDVILLAGCALVLWRARRLKQESHAVLRFAEAQIDLSNHAYLEFAATWLCGAHEEARDVFEDYLEELAKVRENGHSVPKQERAA